MRCARGQEPHHAA